MRGHHHRVSALSALLSVIVMCLAAGCHKAVPSPSDGAGAPVTLIAFAAPADSLISVARMRSWFACTTPLDSLSTLFTLDAAAAARMPPGDSALRSFSRTQDTICARCGLAGGYAEYRWITERLGSSANRPLFDSVKKSLHGG